jgi:hypothetical protein
MRAFEMIFSSKKDTGWYRRTIAVIGILVMYTAIASMLLFYFNGLHLLGFDPE